MTTLTINIVLHQSTNFPIFEPLKLVLFKVMYVLVISQYKWVILQVWGKAKDKG